MDNNSALLEDLPLVRAIVGPGGPFGIDAEPAFDGPAAECPVCGGVIDQLALTLDLVGFEPACCGDCGALLAA